MQAYIEFSTKPHKRFIKKRKKYAIQGFRTRYHANQCENRIKKIKSVAKQEMFHKKKKRYTVSLAP